eukprot:7779149-Ditylum_brightwellii.AAC.1
MRKNLPKDQLCLQYLTDDTAYMRVSPPSMPDADVVPAEMGTTPLSLTSDDPTSSFMFPPDAVDKKMLPLSPLLVMSVLKDKDLHEDAPSAVLTVTLS